MKHAIWIILVAMMLILGCQAQKENTDEAETQEPAVEQPEVAPGFDDNPHKDEVVAFVAEAVVAIETDGTAAFDEFRKHDSAWFEGDRYVFVWGLDGMRYCYPPDPAGEGKNMTSLVDPAGRPIGQMIIDAANSEAGHGWVHYQWPRPDGGEPVWKSTFVQRVTGPDGQNYIVGSGLYKGTE
ncbi:MAG: cache domain-containing protein [Candidatus Cloacimonetes bacterium]|nr:cache domain-containing protein [Candidatus Cloacimonadota bacterium]